MATTEMNCLAGGGGSADLGTLNSLVPFMTSATAPSGTVSASSNYSGYVPYMAFRDFANGYQGWLPSSAGTGWIQYAFPSGTTNIAKALLIYGIWGNDVTISAVKGSTDGTNFDTIATNLSVVNKKYNIFVLDNSKAYNTYKFEFSSLTTNGQGCHIQLFGE